MQVARAALDLGYYLSFSGIITFKNAQDLRDVVAFTPLDRILIETDSPYLAPVPYRGKPTILPLCPMWPSRWRSAKALRWKRWDTPPAATLKRCSRGDAMIHRRNVLLAAGGAVASPPGLGRLVRRFFHGHFARRPCHHHRLAAPGFDPNTRDAKGQVGLVIALKQESDKAFDALLAARNTQVEARNADEAR